MKQVWSESEDKMVDIFEEGETVAYVRTGAIGWEGCDWPEKAGMKLGESYIVQNPSSTTNRPSSRENPFIILKGPNGNLWVYHPDHFIPI